MDIFFLETMGTYLLSLQSPLRDPEARIFIQGGLDDLRVWNIGQNIDSNFTSFLYGYAARVVKHNI